MKLSKWIPQLALRPLAAALFFMTLGPASWALSADVVDVFSRDNRTVEPPSKELRADSEHPEVRYSDNLRAPASDPNEIQATTQQPVVSPEAQPVTNPEDVKASDGTDDSTAAPAPKGRKHKPVENTFHGERVFGIGLVGGGAYGIFGAEIDFGIGDAWTAGLGFGTGMTYDTWALHGRYFFRENQKFNPFFEGGYANWYLRKASRTGNKPNPSFVADRFFADGTGAIQDDSTLNLLYPGIGVLYQATSGIAAFAELQYFINIKGFQGALYGAAGVYYYF